MRAARTQSSIFLGYTRNTHTCTHTYTHAHTYAHMHTYTHTHTHRHATHLLGVRRLFQMLWVEAPVACLCVCVFRGLLAVQIWTEEGRRGYLGKMTHEHIHQSSWLTSRNSGRDEKVKQTQISAGRYDGTLLGIRNHEKSLRDGSRWIDWRWKSQLA